jgi:hypothetical protein
MVRFWRIMLDATEFSARAFLYLNGQPYITKTRGVFSVMPAQAGIQFFATHFWIPAFAGMTSLIGKKLQPIN